MPRKNSKNWPEIFIIYLQQRLFQVRKNEVFSIPKYNKIGVYNSPFMPEEGKPAAFGVPVEEHLKQTFKVRREFYREINLFRRIIHGNHQQERR